MHLLPAILVACLAPFQNSPQEGKPGAPAAFQADWGKLPLAPKDLARELTEMMRLDQLHRVAISWGTTDPQELACLKALDDDAHMIEIQRRWKAGVSLPEKLKAELFAKQTILDRALFARLVEIIKVQGYPDPKRLSIDAPSPVPILIHADLAEFGKHQDLFLREVMAGNMPPKEYAALTDRKRQHAGEQQLYGTCSAFSRELNKVLAPDILDIEVTNRARAKIGLEPLKEYRIVKPKRAPANK